MKLGKFIRKNLLIILTILLLDNFLLILDHFAELSLQNIATVVGLTFFTLTIVSFLTFRKRKRFSIEEGIIIGVAGLVVQGLLSIVIGMLYGIFYPLIYVILLCLKNAILGLGFGSFAGWLANKAIKR